MTDTIDPQTARYRHRTPAVEAVQWTGSNADQLRAFCGPDFDEIDLDDRTEDPDQTAAVREADHGTWRGLAPGDWVVKLDGGLYEFSAADFAKQYEPSTPSAELARAQAEAHQYRTALQGVARRDAAPSAAVSPPPATDRATLSAKLWAVAEHHIVAEWICCEPLEPGHRLCAKGHAALGMAKTLLVDADPEKARTPEAPLLNAVLAELEQLRRERDLAIAHDRQPYPTAWAYEQACKALRTHRDRVDELEQEVRRLGLMVDEYGQGASALTDKLYRARDMHRETCPLARGGVSPTAFRCGMCEVLDAPAVLPPAADRAAALREAAAEADDHSKFHGGSSSAAGRALAYLARTLRRLAAGERDEQQAQQGGPGTGTTADKAEALGMTPAEYRAHCHRTAGEQIRTAARSLYADAGFRVLAALDLSDGPVRCPLCPYPVTLHTPNGARAHFTTVHPEQRITGRGPGPWPLLTTDGDEEQQAETKAPYPPETSWQVETQWHTGDWRSWALRTEHDDALEEFGRVKDGKHAWRLVRFHTTTTVEAEHTPAVVAEPGKEN